MQFFPSYFLARLLVWISKWYEHHQIPKYDSKNINSTIIFTSFWPSLRRAGRPIFSSTLDMCVNTRVCWEENLSICPFIMLCMTLSVLWVSFITAHTNTNSGLLSRTGETDWPLHSVSGILWNALLFITMLLESVLGLLCYFGMSMAFLKAVKIWQSKYEKWIIMSY